MDTSLILIGAMPRSGSAWLSNVLNMHPNSLFLHEGIGKQDDPIRWLYEADYNFIGDIGAHCMFPNLDSVKAKRVYLHRKKNEVIVSAQKFLDLDDDVIEDAVGEIENLADKWCHSYEPYLISYEEVITKKGLEKLWYYIFGEAPEWDKIGQAFDLNVQVHKPSDELKTLISLS